jgi:hypothetical protein
MGRLTDPEAQKGPMDIATKDGVITVPAAKDN